MNLMIDLETLGTDSNTVVLSIGAVLFDNQSIHSSFYSLVNPQEQLDKGRSITWSTLQWWLSQGESAKDVFLSTKEPVKDTLLDFVDFIKKARLDVSPWGNGATFDISIMEDLFIKNGISVPWSFKNVRDLRTFKNTCKDLGIHENTPFIGVAHNAVDDATNQANYVIHMLDKMGQLNVKNITKIKERA